MKKRREFKGSSHCQVAVVKFRKWRMRYYLLVNDRGGYAWRRSDVRGAYTFCPLRAGDDFIEMMASHQDSIKLIDTIPELNWIKERIIAERLARELES